MELKRLLNILSLIEKNDPIIHLLNVSSIRIDHKSATKIVKALHSNVFITEVNLSSNMLEPISFDLFFSVVTIPIITRLEISNNGLDDDAIERFSKILRKLPPNHPHLTIILRSNIFGARGSEALGEALGENAPIKYLDLRGNSNIKDYGLSLLIDKLASNSILQTLDILNCGFGMLAAQSLSISLLQNNTLATIMIQDKLSVDVFNNISFVLSTPQCSLVHLYLWNSLLTAEHIETLCNSLQNNTLLKTLALSYNKIDDSASLSLSKMLLHNKSIMKLQLGHNKITENFTPNLSLALQYNSTLNYLDLSRNSIKVAGLWALSCCLSMNKALQVLDIRYNEIEIDGIPMLCNLIENNKSILWYRLSGNFFGDTGISLLSKTLLSENSSHLIELELNDIGMTTEGFILLCKAIENHPNLEKLHVCFNALSSLALEAFAQLLKKNNILKSMMMIGCSIMDDSCTYIANGLDFNSTLEHLSLSNNYITETGVDLIINALMGNFSLLSLDLTGNPFLNSDSDHLKILKISNYLDRNNYYVKDMLMQDLSQLVLNSSLD